MRTCSVCGHPFVPRHPRVWRCPEHEPGRDERGPTTRAQRDGTGDYERNRAIVLAGAPRCSYGCGQPATTVDHVVSVARGGTNALSNLVPCCGPCNSRKGARPARVAPAHAFQVPLVSEGRAGPGPVRLV
jgi:5-methylcytosine-specific restriction endonuclease McrA